MIISQDVFNQKCMTTEHIFKSEVLGGDVRVRDLSISETEEFRRLFSENQLMAVYYAASRVCVEPSIPENALADGTQTLLAFVNEIVSNIQYFGMSEEEKQEAINKQLESVTQKVAELTKEEEAKKPKRKNTSS